VKLAAIGSMDPTEYVAHELHRAERAWNESNCYIDVWIEVLHSLGCEPRACLPFVLEIDWEVDQFTFVKPSHSDLAKLYGVEVVELNVYRSLLENTLAQLASGRLVLAEVDAFFLPDTVGTDYRKAHTKTTIGIQEMDVEASTLGYFHNSSYHSLGRDDFAELFRLGTPLDTGYMPFFAELVKIGRLSRLPGDMMVARSIALMKEHLGRRPTDNPVSRFRERLGDDLERLRKEGLGAYHVYAFATVRQFGAAFELAALYLAWLARQGEAGLDECISAFTASSDSSKTLILKMARAVAASRPVDVLSTLSDIEQCWAFGMRTLARRYGVV
jgi:Domain of unknown function (DUF1839)